MYPMSKEGVINSWKMLGATFVMVSGCSLSILGIREASKQGEGKIDLILQTNTGNLLNNRLIIDSGNGTTILPENFDTSQTGSAEISINGRIAFTGQDLSNNQNMMLFATRSIFSKDAEPILSWPGISLVGWSPDGKLLFFSGFSSITSSSWDIYTMNIDSREIKKVTDDNDDQGHLFGVGWSADSKKIYYNYYGDKYTAGVYSKDIDGKNRKLLLEFDNLSGQNNYLGTLSPDHNLMSFNYVSRDKEQQFVFHIGVLNLKNLSYKDVFTLNPGQGMNGIRNPKFSPDNKFIAFECQLSEGKGIALYLVDIETSELKMITDIGFNNLTGFKDDGSLYFYHQKNAYSPSDVYENGIYSINIDGSNIKLISKDDAATNQYGWTALGQLAK